MLDYGYKITDVLKDKLYHNIATFKMPLLQFCWLQPNKKAKN